MSYHLLRRWVGGADAAAEDAPTIGTGPEDGIRDGDRGAEGNGAGGGEVEGMGAGTYYETPHRHTSCL